MILSTLLTGGAALSTVVMWKPKRFRKATQKLLLAPSKPAASQRKQQLREISGGENKISDDEKDLNRKIKIFAVSFSIASAAALVNPMLGLIGMPVTFYIVKDVFAGSYRSLKKKKLNVDTLVALLMSLMLVRGHFLLCNYYLVLYLVNRKLNFKLKHNSSNQIVDVFKQQPKSVWLLRDGVEIEVPFESIEQDDTVVVSAGEKIPVDGIIIQGQATVDQHLLTGESQPVEKEVRDEVFALTIVLTGRIQVRVERAGTETTVAQIGDILNRTVDSKTDVQRRSERFTDGTVGPTFLLSGAVWPLLGPTSAMIVMNSHFRYRMNIITAASVLNFLNLAAQQGVLIKDGRALEALKKVDTVVFDKTGTLTLDQPHVAKIHAAADYSADAILALAAAAEAKQSHPIAKAICEEAKAYQLDLPQMDEAEYQLGFGLSVVMNGHTIRVGSIRFMQQSNCKIDTTLQVMADHCLEQGNSVVMVAKDDEVIGAIELEATIRPEASQVIESIRELQGAEIHVISGDQEAPTRNLAEKLKIDHYFAETLPENKADLIAELQQAGRTVCYVGDGINDSIALKQADVSVSLKGASSIAVDVAEIILMDGKLHQLSTLFTLSQDFEKNLKLTNKGILIPCFASLGGAVVPGFTLMDSMFLSAVSVFAGFSGAMLPLTNQSQDKYKRLNST